MLWHNMYAISSFFIFITGLFVFCSMRKHLLLTLLGLEYLVLCIYMGMSYFLVYLYGDMYLIMIFLCFSVCEGVLGLSLLVTLIRSYGNDQVNILSLLLW
uniref:NADH dehydrogenase subunit 4L n=1 Tax=Stethoconus japonicus TaxID=1929845 RepID=UPI0022F33125|nr:NADH dehydrogenase subunit 4L [Stethoconus japonicus]UFQ24463.1 NADH dehydrogenase subunit 4L [Stethoconus japonicus]